MASSASATDEECAAPFCHPTPPWTVLEIIKVIIKIDFHVLFAHKLFSTDIHIYIHTFTGACAWSADADDMLLHLHANSVSGALL